MTETHRMTAEGHLQRDPRLDVWSVNGFGPYSHSTEDWVEMILSFKFDISLPPFVESIYARAQSCMVYGCYHYPLFTLGIEELYRYLESALRAAVEEAGASSTVRKYPYAKLIIWAKNEGLIAPEKVSIWDAGRGLRNSTTHKSGPFLLGPNHALQDLKMAKELTEELFRTCRSRSQLAE